MLRYVIICSKYLLYKMGRFSVVQLWKRLVMVGQKDFHFLFRLQYFLDNVCIVCTSHTNKQK